MNILNSKNRSELKVKEENSYSFDIIVHKFIVKKHISWKQLASVNVQHNTLTLVYKDQHMKQWVYDNANAQAEEVLAYAAAQIEKNTLAITNDW